MRIVFKKTYYYDHKIIGKYSYNLKNQSYPIILGAVKSLGFCFRV